MRALLFTLLLTSNLVSGQTIFAPLGAGWTYITSPTAMVMGNPQWPYSMWVTGDTVLLGYTASVIHFQGYSDFHPFNIGSGETADVAVATSGDSILLYTEYDSSFHPLMIFNALPGDTWSIPLTLDLGWEGHPIHDTITYTAVSCDTLWYESIPLRRMRYTCSTLNQLFDESFFDDFFVERIGDLEYLFPWPPAGMSDYIGFDYLECYSDPEFAWPTTQVSCGLQISTPEQEGTSGAPFPTVIVQDRSVLLTAPDEGLHHVLVTDLLGRTVHSSVLRAGQTRIDLNATGSFVILLVNEQGQRHAARFVCY